MASTQKSSTETIQSHPLPPSNRSNSADCPPNFFTTDDVIAELKDLAKTMLAASQAARERVSLDDIEEKHKDPMEEKVFSSKQATAGLPRHKPSDEVFVGKEKRSEPPKEAAVKSRSSDPSKPKANAEKEGNSSIHDVLDALDGFIEEDEDLDLALSCVKSSDTKLFQTLTSSLWLPEPVKLAIEDSQEGEESEKPPLSFRVPLFPYGGGITALQLRELLMKYLLCQEKPIDRSAQPEKIVKEAFDRDKYEEISAIHHRFVPQTLSQKATQSVPSPCEFTPQSLYDFVVELAPTVRFDAARARKERRVEFKRLLQEKKAVSTPGTFHLKVIMDPTSTGFQEQATFPVTPGTLIANRYQIVHLIAKSTFCRTVRCNDLNNPIYEDDEGSLGEEREPIGYREVCVKIIHNNKDFFDQSLDEIRLLRLINQERDADEVHVIRLLDAFYHKEHCMLVTELLSDSLYEFSRFNREEEKEFYFTIPRLQLIARQVTEALEYIHSLNLIHADLKPENIMFASHRRCVVKIIDFGSSSFLSDHLSSYIQSRSYRAPEVILGCDYDGRIDIWSFGAILMELVTGNVLFPGSTVPEMLARIVVECGHPLPRRMLWEGRVSHKFVTKFGIIYEAEHEKKQEEGEESYYVYFPQPHTRPPRPTSRSDAAEKEYNFIYHHEDGAFVQLRKKLVGAGLIDEIFTDFIEKCLVLDHKKRPTAKQLLEHPFIKDIRSPGR